MMCVVWFHFCKNREKLQIECIHVYESVRAQKWKEQSMCSGQCWCGTGTRGVKDHRHSDTFAWFRVAVSAATFVIFEKKLNFFLTIAQSCPTLCDPMDYTGHGILQARILEWVAFPFSRGSSQPRDQAQVSRIAGRFFTSWAINQEKKITDKRKKDRLDLGGSQIRFQTCLTGNSLVVQWLRLQAPNAGGPGLIPGQGTRSHILQLRPRAAK